MSNLIAYIPVLNQRHIDWFEKHPDSHLFLIKQSMAEELMPRLSRNVGAIQEDWVMLNMIDSTNKVRTVSNFGLDLIDPMFSQFTKEHWILPDEDVSHTLFERYLEPLGHSVEFEDIHARYDMTAVKRQSPVMDGIDETSNHDSRMELARIKAKQSPDWWRQIGAALFVNGELAAVACNNHFPTEYVTDIFGDPRLNVDAGQIGKYVSFHSEKTVLMECARNGIPTAGSILYTTVFPCEDCARAIVLAGIDQVFFEEGYSALDAQEVLQGAGVKIVRSVRPTK